MSKVPNGQLTELDDTPIKLSLEMYRTILQGIQEQIRFADSKAGFVAALNAVLFGFLASNIQAIRTVAAQPDKVSWGFWAAIGFSIFYLLATAVSVFHIVSSVVSRFGIKAPQTDVFFGHIAGIHGSDHVKYVRETMNYNARQWAQQIGTQIVEVSQIALTKHQLVRRAACFTVAAFIFWTIALILIALLPLAAKA